MVEVSRLFFIIVSLVLIVTPGEDMILVMSRSVAQGPAVGVVTAAGVSVGLIGHTVLVTLGLGAILRASEWLFLALKLVGAAYLLYLGGRLLLTKHSDLALGATAQRSLSALFIDRAFANLCNPKIAVFYFAFCRSSCCPRRNMRRSQYSFWDLRLPCLRFLSKDRLASSLVRCRGGCAPGRACSRGCTARVVRFWSVWV